MVLQDIDEWPIIDPLPSYGRGRELPGGRYSNFIMGSNLTDVIITGIATILFKASAKYKFPFYCIYL